MVLIKYQAHFVQVNERKNDTKCQKEKIKYLAYVENKNSRGEHVIASLAHMVPV